MTQYHGLTPQREKTKNVTIETPAGDKVPFTCRVLTPVDSVLLVEENGVFLYEPVKDATDAARAGLVAHREKHQRHGLHFSRSVAVENLVLTFSAPWVTEKTDVADAVLEEIRRDCPVLVFEGTTEEFRDSVWFDAGYRVYDSFWFNRDQVRFESVSGSRRTRRVQFLALVYDDGLRRRRAARAQHPKSPPKPPKPKVSKEHLLLLCSSLRTHTWGLQDTTSYMDYNSLCHALNSMLAKFCAIHGEGAYRGLKVYVDLLRTYRDSTQRNHLTSAFQDWADEELATPAVQRLLRAKKFVERSYHYDSQEFSKVYNRRRKREEAEKAKAAKAQAAQTGADEVEQAGDPQAQEASPVAVSGTGEGDQNGTAA